MIKRIFLTIIIVATLTSCGNNSKKVSSTNADNTDNYIKVEFASLAQNPDNYIDKNIVVEGKVVHVCTMSGKKLFIVGDDPDISLFIAAGEDMPKFPMELLGCKVVVEGLVTRAAAMFEDEIPGSMMKMTSMVENLASVEECETEAALSAQTSLADIIVEYKSHTVK